MMQPKKKKTMAQLKAISSRINKKTAAKRASMKTTTKKASIGGVVNTTRPVFKTKQVTPTGKAQTKKTSFSNADLKKKK